MEEFWKDDYRPLQWAGASVLQALRDDEDAPDADLYRRLTQSPEGSHLYLCPPSNSSSTGNNNTGEGTSSRFSSSSRTPTSSATSTTPVLQLQHRQSIPLPPLLTDAMRSAKTSSFMGLLAAIGMGWLTVDDKVYLFGVSDSTAPVQCFSNPRQQPFLTVGLVKPKKGIFKPLVEWCLVVTTPEEVLLLALARLDAYLQLIPTSFVMPTDFIRMTSVVGTAEGRIFLGGDDGCLHEMVYEDTTATAMNASAAEPQTLQQELEKHLDSFYDGTKALPSVLRLPVLDGGVWSSQQNLSDTVVLLGKRTWNSLAVPTARSSSGDDGPARKCRKINRSSEGPAIATALVPNILRQAARLVMGGNAAQEGGPVIQMVHDADRHILYTLSQKGWIAVWDLQQAGGHSTVVAVCNVPQTARLYLEAVSRGQMYPPHPTSSTVGQLNFPGGGGAAQNGVGGMEGARKILKMADWTLSSNGNKSGTSHKTATKNGRKEGSQAILTPVSLHVISAHESSRLTLVAVTAGGLRLYFSSLQQAMFSTNSASTTANSSTRRALGNRLVLCHVRSPPPLTPPSSSSLTTGASSSLTWLEPKIRGTRISNLDAAFYNQGHFVAAMEDSNQVVGSNVLVATAPCTVLRPRDEANPHDDVVVDTSISSGPNGSLELNAAAGLSESVGFPVAHALDAGPGMLTPASPILQGGRVWQIDALPQPTSGALKLLWHSPTPTTVELEMGLPPPYYPPSQIRSSTTSNGKTETPGIGVSLSNSRALATQEAAVRSTALQTLASIVSNYVSRPWNFGLTGLDKNSRPEFGRNYRVSTRNGLEGFGLSAAESSRAPVRATGTRRNTRSRSSTGNNGGSSSTGNSSSTGKPRSSSSTSRDAATTKSARLRSSLLKPSTTALNHWTVQHMMEGKRVLVLTVQGIHHFEFNTILSSLAKTLMAAGDNVMEDAAITNFFASYGYKEGCAMCLTLAVGCGPAGGNAGYNQQLRRRACDAAMARAYVPQLVRDSDHLHNEVAVSTSLDPCIPTGYSFRPSSIYEGLTSLASRLVRPLWHKPLVVVTEGRAVEFRWSPKRLFTAAKVELLLDDKTLEEIRVPLQSLQALMKTVFARAIDSVPATAAQQTMAMEIDDGINQDQYLTQALQYHSQFRNSSGGTSSQLTSRECENIAHLLEERNIHSLYRLIARFSQLLNLFSLLQKSQGVAGIPEIDWGVLHGVTAAQLVQLRDGHERVEALLNELVVSSASSNKASVAAGHVDQLAHELANQCYLFFPPASRFAYQGLRFANIALGHPLGSEQRKDATRQAAQNLQDAAKHWFSPSLITGRIVRSNGKEGFRETADRAIQYNSPLAKATDVLVKLQDVSNAVRICLATSQNFKRSKTSAGKRDFSRSDGMLSWEADLYHKNTIPRSDEERKADGGTGGEASKVDPYGTSVTAQDAVDTCYSLVFYHLNILLKENRDLAYAMVSSASASADKAFLQRMFAFLVESDNLDTLLMIDCTETEGFLRKHNEPSLLWRYFNVQSRFVDAGRVALDCAKMVDAVPIGIRIEWLTRALSSFRSGQNAPPDIRRRWKNNISDEDLASLATEADATLRIANLQGRILRSVDSLAERPPEIDEEKYQQLTSSLVSVTPLYNDFAATVPLFDICLVIFHTCRHDNAEAIRSVWKNCVCEELLPCATRSEQTYQRLRAFVDDLNLQDRVKFLSDNMSDVGYPNFESGSWVSPVQQKVERLGKELYGTGADHTFPVEYILEILDFLQSLHPRNLSPAWALTTMAEAGVPHLMVLHVYHQLWEQFDFTSGSNSVKQNQYISASLEFLSFWIARSRSAGRTAGEPSVAHGELARAIATGELKPKLNGLRARAECMSGDVSHFLDHLNRIESEISLLVGL